MVELINFSSVIQLSAAVHLATGIFIELRSNFLGPMHWHVDYVKQHLPYYQHHKMDMDSDLLLGFERVWIATHSFDNVWNKAYYVVEPWIRRFTYLSIIIAIYSISLLVVAGFNKSLKVNEGCMAMILAVAILPMPVSALTLWLKMRTYRDSISVAGYHLQNEFDTFLDKFIEKFETEEIN